jgi:glycosyltransferase involved in cell wall biosynthesis
MPQVSVIIPLYNKGKYISRALDSVFAQTYQDYEIIVVDDGSNDNGPDVVKQYKDPRLRLIQQDNAGPGAARNRGVGETTGPYVAFLDADDEWMQAFLQKSLNALKNNPDCALSATGWYQDYCSFYSSQGPIDMVQVFRNISGIDRGPWILSKNASDLELQHMLDMIWTCSVVCRRDVFLRYGGFYNKSRCVYGEDHYLWIQMAFNHEIYRIMEPLAWYHNSVSDLTYGGFKYRPLDPCMTDPDPIRANCLSEHRQSLERWFAQYALIHAHICASYGKINEASYLLRAFPLMKIWWWEYEKLKFKLMFPQLISFGRRLKGRPPVD